MFTIFHRENEQHSKFQHTDIHKYPFEQACYVMYALPPLRIYNEYVLLRAQWTVVEF